MGKYEVTQKEYQAVMGWNQSTFKGDNMPVENVSWYDAVEYCNRLSKREKLTPAYTISGTNIRWNRNANGYRLPTEAEWEYACRAGTTTEYNMEDYISESMADYDNVTGTVPAGSYAPNTFGLYDMHGSVMEWCWDWYDDKYNTSELNNPLGASSGFGRVIRNGCWADESLPSLKRTWGNPALGFKGIGFRVVLPDSQLKQETKNNLKYE
jgi:formylglycine-generating enzyme required for sulfatase activity